MAWQDLQADPMYTWITGLATIFFCWAAQEFLERKCGMEPSIRDINKMEETAAKSDDPKNSYIINRRLTKALDQEGRYRITTRGTVYYIKGVWAFCLLVTGMVGTIALYPDWWYDHFIQMDRSTVYFPINQHIAASIAAFYAWEVSTNRYGKLSWSMLIHHWLTIGAAVAILCGYYTPFATHYAYTGVGMAFSVAFAMGARATVCDKYPNFTRKFFVFCTFWYTMVTMFNMAGQLYLITAASMNGKIPMASVILMCFTMLGWIHDDWQLVKALWDFSSHNYEDAELYAQQSTLRGLGGRTLSGWVRDIISNKDEDKELKQVSIRGKTYKKVSQTSVDQFKFDEDTVDTGIHSPSEIRNLTSSGAKFTTSIIEGTPTAEYHE